MTDEPEIVEIADLSPSDRFVGNAYAIGDIPLLGWIRNISACRRCQNGQLRKRS